MSLEVTGPAPKDRPGNPVAAKQLDNGILAPVADPLDEVAQCKRLIDSKAYRIGGGS